MLMCVCACVCRINLCIYPFKIHVFLSKDVSRIILQNTLEFSITIKKLNSKLSLFCFSEIEDFTLVPHTLPNLVNYIFILLALKIHLRRYSSYGRHIQQKSNHFQCICQEKALLHLSFKVI